MRDVKPLERSFPSHAGMRCLCQHSGFSLIEFLASLALLALLASVLAGSMRLGHRVWSGAEEKTEAIRRIYDTQTALTKLFQDFQPLHTGAGLGTVIDFRGRADTLEGVVHLPHHLGRGGFYRIRLFQDNADKSLVVSFQAYVSKNERKDRGADHKTVTRLLPNVERLSFRYFGVLKGDGAAEWRDVWDAEDKLPALLAIKVEMAGSKQKWPDLLIAPRNSPVEWR